MATESIESSSRVAELAALLDERLQAGRLGLPVMPEVALRVQQAAAQRGVGAKQLSQIVETSPALAARVLRMTNSAMFQGMTEITDLSHAIGRLGTTMVVALALGAAAKETFRSGDPVLSSRLRDAWRGSIYASAAARHLATRWGLVADEAFLAGLLHAVGEPALCQQVEELVSKEDLPRPDRQELSEILEQMRPVAGSRLLSEWGLPRRLVAAVQFQENPGLAPAECRPGASVTGLAAFYGRRRAFDTLEPEEIAGELADSAIVTSAGLDRNGLEPLLRQATYDGGNLESVFTYDA
jgi:HD-like signal output (HDOD) protein